MKLKYNDKVHGYWLDGKRCKSVTGLAKLPDDSFNLVAWKTRQIAIGLAKSPHLVESVAAHHTDRTKLDELCEAAMTAAGADQAAEWGTTVHRIAERIDQGEEIIDTPTVSWVRKVWRELLPAANLAVVPEFTERVVVYPERKLCGKLDRIARRVDTGTLHVCDVKTGESAIKYPHSTAIQLALYSHAPLLAGAWDGLDGVTEEFTPLPEGLDPDVGYVLYVPVDGMHATVYEVDLALAWRCVEEIVWPTLRWRAVKNERLIKPVAIWDPGAAQ